MLKLDPERPSRTQDGSKLRSKSNGNSTGPPNPHESVNKNKTLETMKNAELIGTYFSKDWVMKNVLRMSDEDVVEMDKQIKGEAESGETEEPDDNQQEDYYEEVPEIIEEVSPLDEEGKILDNKVKEKELQVLENVAQALAN